MGPTHDRFGLMKMVLQTVVLWRSYRVYEALVQQSQKGLCVGPIG